MKTLVILIGIALVGAGLIGFFRGLRRLPPHKDTPHSEFDKPLGPGAPPGAL
ncbi:MAG: hypothetical protein ACOY3L_07450 [Pseudomonadota bacterium]